MNNVIIVCNNPVTLANATSVKYWLLSHINILFNYEVKMPRATAEQVNNSCINIDGEEWRDVLDYESIYQVSTIGRVKHSPTTIVEVSSTGEVISTRQTKEYILKQSTNKFGYSVVGLTRNSKVNVIGVHRLVASAFIPHLDEQIEVHHIDVNSKNNSVDNLIWVSPREHDNLHRCKPRHNTA